MKQLFFIFPLLFMLLMQSCSSNSVQQPLNDIYRVEVGTYLNVRATPSKNGTVLGTIENGTLVEVTEISDGWAKVSYMGEDIGYISSDYLVLVREGRRHHENVAESNHLEESTDVDPQSEASNTDFNNQDETSDTYTSTHNGNVYFIGDTSLLTSYDKEIIDRQLANSPNYVYIINTVRSVPTGKIFDYAPDLFKEKVKELGLSTSWWQGIKSLFGGHLPSSNIVMLSYIEECGLLQAECNGTSLKYLKMAQPEKYFRLQNQARSDVSSAIYSLGIAIEDAGKEYESRNWFIKGQINTGDFINIMCDDFIVQNILPHDSFMHKWILGWLFAVPLSIANRLFVITGSYLGSLFLLMLIIVGLHCIVSFRTFKYNQAGMQGCVTIAIRLVNLFIWLCMLSLVVYMIPDMSNIAVMEQSGFSDSVTSLAIKSGMKNAVTKNWFLIAMYWIGSLVYMCVNATIALNATLPSLHQWQLFRANKDNMKTHMQMADIDSKNIEDSMTPYTDILLQSLGSKELGQSLPPTILLSFVLSGTVILYTCIFIWTIVLKRAVFFIAGVFAYKRMGYYN